MFGTILTAMTFQKKVTTDGRNVTAPYSPTDEQFLLRLVENKNKHQGEYSFLDGFYFLSKLAEG
ncbi:hypothetical protein [Schinkia azotoformans]|uniref:hypothetical protein n=1 Tax=Schinkia azotoformans TaxID=1454 RepID=UPI002DB57BD2|nr:hypothetical protein [Schinkia azotoformans]MEC1759866.1 hypothetical protein [Schinkia azotoformans]